MSRLAPVLPIGVPKLLVSTIVAAAGGFSRISVEGAQFHDPEADAAFVTALQTDLDPRIPLHLSDLAINDPAFARQLDDAMDRALSTTKGQ